MLNQSNDVHFSKGNYVNNYMSMFPTAARIGYNVVVCIYPRNKIFAIIYGQYYHISTITLDLIMHTGRSGPFMSDTQCDKQLTRVLLNT
jgi:hypothetical protein